MSKAVSLFLNLESATSLGTFRHSSSRYDDNELDESDHDNLGESGESGEMEELGESGESGELGEMGESGELRNSLNQTKNSSDDLLKPNKVVKFKGNDGSSNKIKGSSDDLLEGGAGNNKLDGKKGNDRLVGGAGNDYLEGGKGNDTLLGGAGNDLLKGGEGQDILTGGAGSDVFEIKYKSNRPGYNFADVITDFQDGVDKLKLDDLRFSDIQVVQGSGRSANNTLIQLASTGETLATLQRVNASLINTSDFTFS
ncbi:MAG: hypothetical protein KME15_17035 [Drouetiella hepatica Uher 2000/2452]|jgi:Ca2+-binding RTX toxin-like protein|uniref:Peptidase M10 serralysin C-terminal domain-containing protein n=1 Tax=Drouetiella hepatica Uher 2000/2452 TaxID=904376 RepID=A0A951UN65_9CYAN|nr:hypothetical protein [Drouetiella hepatica Uher 2000/2452]